MVGGVFLCLSKVKRKMYDLMSRLVEFKYFILKFFRLIYDLNANQIINSYAS